MKKAQVKLVILLVLALFLGPFAGLKGQTAGESGESADSSRISSVRDNAPRVRAKFVPDSIAIGDQFVLEVEVQKDIMQVLGYPEFDNDMLGEIIEIVAEFEEDTVKVEGRTITLVKKYLLQTFEDGYFNLGHYPMLYAEKNLTDTIWSVDSMLLKVGTFEIDTLTMTIHDIKAPMKAPLLFGEISGYMMIASGLIVLLSLLGWYLYTRKKNLSLLGKAKVYEPPHVVAIKALESLHNHKLWQNNKHKLYYTGITDILREYIEKRYHVRALEMTSDEIIDSLGVRGLPEKSYTDLTSILKTADLVKFAKYVPDAETNETVYTNAYYFVESTKPDEVELNPENGEEV